MIKFSKVILLPLIIFLASCSGNKEKKDTSELYAKSQTRQAIIERSGTTMGGGGSVSDRKLQLDDAENRLRAGGGLFGKKGGLGLFNGDNKSKQTTSMGMPINPYLWKASLETVNFMPLSSADPFAGLIITDWYSQNNVGERCKLNIFIKGVELKTNNLKVNSFCQVLSSSNIWIDEENNLQANIQLEDAILNKAKKLKLLQN